MEARQLESLTRHVIGINGTLGTVIVILALVGVMVLLALLLLVRVLEELRFVRWYLTRGRPASEAAAKIPEAELCDGDDCDVCPDPELFDEQGRLKDPDYWKKGKNDA